MIGVDLVNDMSRATQDADSLYGGDVVQTTNVLATVAPRMKTLLKHALPEERTKFAQKFTSDLVKSADHLLTASSAWTDLASNAQQQAAVNVMNAVDEAALLFVDSMQTHKRQTIGVRNICELHHVCAD
jgi:hypothetical protein